jgi:hypothetical protein
MFYEIFALNIYGLNIADMGGARSESLWVKGIATMNVCLQPEADIEEKQFFHR